MFLIKLKLQNPNDASFRSFDCSQAITFVAIILVMWSLYDSQRTIGILQVLATASLLMNYFHFFRLFSFQKFTFILLLTCFRTLDFNSSLVCNVQLFAFLIFFSFFI